MEAVRPPRPLLEEDDRSLLDCGRASINAWFQRHAWLNQGNGNSRVSVLATPSGRIVGIVTLSATQIERSFLPKAQQRSRPAQVPATLLGQLAVDLEFQGQGHASSLLLFALKTALQASAVIGSAGVVTHPLDDGIRPFYARWGFQELPYDPKRAMFIRTIDLAQSFSGS